jgi:hypothetical protein
MRRLRLLCCYREVSPFLNPNGKGEKKGGKYAGNNTGKPAFRRIFAFRYGTGWIHSHNLYTHFRVFCRTLFGCFFEWGKGKERKELTAREGELEESKNKREREAQAGLSVWSCTKYGVLMHMCCCAERELGNETCPFVWMDGHGKMGREEGKDVDYEMR